MDLLTHFARWLEFDDWANRETLAALAAAGEPPPRRAVRFMAHVVAVERLWLGRLERDGAPVVVWPELGLAECAAGLDELRPRWRAYLAGLAPADLARPVPYVNSLGESWTSTVEDILTQTVMHSVHHRGQIAAELRSTGHEPPYVDFVHATRRGYVR